MIAVLLWTCLSQSPSAHVTIHGKPARHVTVLWRKCIAGKAAASIFTGPVKRARKMVRK